MTFTPREERVSGFDFAGWCIVELLGHRRLAGYVTEQEIAGAAFLRIELPLNGTGSDSRTIFAAPSSVYAITPVDEEIARAVAMSDRPRPVSAWDLKALAAAPSTPYGYDDETDSSGYIPEDDEDEDDEN